MQHPETDTGFFGPHRGEKEHRHVSLMTRTEAFHGPDIVDPQKQCFFYYYFIIFIIFIIFKI